MSDYKITFAAHTGGLRDEVKEAEVSRTEFKRITMNEFVSAGSHTYQRYELTDYTATYLSIHPLRLHTLNTAD